MDNSTIHMCPDWLYRIKWSNETTIEDINQILMTRNIPGLVFVCILMLTGFLGNAIVLYIFFTKFARSNYRTYVLCLALLDEISSCFLMPFIIIYLVYPKHFPDNILCKFGHFVGYYTSTASAFLLILIAIDRYRKICQPMKRQISKLFAKRSCVIINIVAAIISIQSMFIYGTTTRPTGLFNVTETICFMEKDPFLATYGRVFYIQLQICLAFVIVFITVLYFNIMRKLHTHKRKSMQRLRLSSSSGPKTVRTRKTTLTFIVITLIFAISSEIHHALAMILHFVDNLECHMNKAEGTAFYIFLWAVFINNVSNPFIYGVSDDRFRSHVKEMLKKNQDYKPNNRKDSKSSVSE